MAALRRNPRYTRDMIDGGNGQFTNPPNTPILKDGVIYQARIRVFEERSGRLIREQWSNEDGTWSIAYLRRGQTYLLVAYDGAYPAQAYDFRTPDLMT